MTHNQRNKLAEAMRLIREVMAENGGEQLPLIPAPDVASMTYLTKATRSFIRALYRNYGMAPIDPHDKKFLQFQADFGMMNIHEFYKTMEKRGVIERTFVGEGSRKITKHFRFLKTIPQ